jgi:hypothetical protein
MGEALEAVFEDVVFIEVTARKASRFLFALAARVPLCRATNQSQSAGRATTPVFDGSYFCWRSRAWTKKQLCWRRATMPCACL